MDYGRMAELTLRIQHRHPDGSWGSLEPSSSPHDPAAIDPERDWADSDATLFRCKTCDEQVVVSHESDPGLPR